MKCILDRLERFDKEHGWDHYNKISGDGERLEVLQKEIVSMLGEFGEFANEVKKCGRKGVCNFERLNEEAVDMFMFMLKIVKTLGMDIEKEFNDKMDRNEERFREFGK